MICPLCANTLIMDTTYMIHIIRCKGCGQEFSNRELHLTEALMAAIGRLEGKVDSLTYRDEA